MKHYKIVAITQVHNELRKGHLERFFKYIPAIVDDVVVYDDASSDGSWEYAKKYTPHVIRGNKNDFTSEREHKKLLLKKALELQPDFILSIDADEVVADPDGARLQQLAAWATEQDLDGVRLHDINLWKSNTYARTDNDFDTARFLRFWRVRENIAYEEVSKPGLHQSPAPDSIKNVKDTDIVSLLHYGFATDKSIIAKYLTYAMLGQKGQDLARLIDEHELQLRSVDSSLFPSGLWQEESKPTSRPLTEWFMLSEQLKPELLRPSISIVALIYKSTDWLKFCYEQVLKYTDLKDKEFFFVANDASEEVKACLQEQYIPHYIFNNTEEHKQEWYINNVYRAWNYGATQAKGDYILFINSDMAFTPRWVEKLYAHLDGHNCVGSRLVESGKLATGGLNIEKDFGKLIEEYKELEFQEYAQTISLPELVEGGAFMPLLIKREDFLKVGGYPEGNVVRGSNIHHPTIGTKTDDLVSGDIVLMEKLAAQGIIHKTAFDSLSYHFQEGEMTSLADDLAAAQTTEVIVANNSLTGAMQEKVMWNFLLEGLPHSAPIDMATVGAEAEQFEIKAREYIARTYPNSKIIIQNASFINTIDPQKFTIAYLQDNLRRMRRTSIQQENNLDAAGILVTNSYDTAASYPEFYFNCIPIGVDDTVFVPGDKQSARKQYSIGRERVGIFVGDLSPVKGWSEIRTLIERHPEITWIVVSKTTEQYHAPNVKMFNRVDQRTLASLHQCADFFIIGSPVETQCLAAMEACFCNVPVIMKSIGIFLNFTEEERAQCGIFGDDFEAALAAIGNHARTPRDLMLAKGLHVQGMIDKWWQLIALTKLRNYTAPPPRASTGGSGRTFRKKLLMTLGNKNYVQSYVKRRLPPSIYRFSLLLWRTAKRIKRGLQG